MVSELRSAMVLAAAAAAVVLAACGGDARRAPVVQVTSPSVSVPPGTARVTDPERARYVRAVDAVCARDNPRREQAVADAEAAPDVAGAVKAYNDDITIAQGQLRGVSGVTPPPADRVLIRANVLDRLQQRIVLRRALRDDLSRSDAASAQRHRAQLDALTLTLESFARGYGFKVCGSG
jgi:hypothetical protein